MLSVKMSVDIRLNDENGYLLSRLYSLSTGFRTLRRLPAGGKCKDCEEVLIMLVVVAAAEDGIQICASTSGTVNEFSSLSSGN